MNLTLNLAAITTILALAFIIRTWIHFRKFDKKHKKGKVIEVDFLGEEHRPYYKN